MRITRIAGLSYRINSRVNSRYSCFLENVLIGTKPKSVRSSLRHKLGYPGDYRFEDFNDDYQQMPLENVAKRARQSALWLSEGILRRSVPLPNQIKLKRKL